ncbi:alpha/beta fold hydrolase [Vibrio sp. WXL103]|uniref:alpha/beta fold hydrolase n=1 Tax=Vibrio sp. WXL103 TaxID=3450710 RepID=UPI003EC7A310
MSDLIHGTSDLLQESVVTLEWGKLSYQEYTPAAQMESPTTVIFLHGWLDNAASFSSTIEHLVKLQPNLRIIAVDLPGHGWSDHKLLGQYYNFHDYLHDISQLVSKLSATGCWFVGHSLGALLAACYCAAFPEQVSGLVQIEGVLPLSEEPDQHAKRIRSAIVNRQRIEAKPVKSIGNLQSAISRRSQVNRLEEALIAPIVERGTVCRQGRWYWRHDRRLMAESIYRMTPAHADVIARSIECPWQIILGSEGYQALTRQWIDYLDQQQVDTIEGGHHCHLQAPKRVAEIISGIVNKF